MKVTFKSKEMFPTRYASGTDLAGKAYTLTIAKIAFEEMTNPKTHETHSKPVIYFLNAKRGFVLGKQFAESIAIALGEWEAQKWYGRIVQIYPTQTRLGIGVRARPAPNGETPPPPAIAGEGEDEEEDAETQ
jgi:hypothetical protein